MRGLFWLKDFRWIQRIGRITNQGSQLEITGGILLLVFLMTTRTTSVATTAAATVLPFILFALFLGLGPAQRQRPFNVRLTHTTPRAIRSTNNFAIVEQCFFTEKMLDAPHNFNLSLRGEPYN